MRRVSFKENVRCPRKRPESPEKGKRNRKELLRKGITCFAIGLRVSHANSRESAEAVDVIMTFFFASDMFEIIEREDYEEGIFVFTEGVATAVNAEKFVKALLIFIAMMRNGIDWLACMSFFADYFL